MTPELKGYLLVSVVKLVVVFFTLLVAVACVLMIPILTVVSDNLGIYGAYVVTVKGFGVNAQAYWEFSRRFISPYDVSTGLI